MANLPASDPLAVRLVTAIQRGDVDALRHLLGDNPGLSRVRIGDGLDDLARSLLHIATDWPGHFPNGVAIVSALVDGGADVHARFVGCGMESAETPLHWSAALGLVSRVEEILTFSQPPSSDDVTNAFWCACHGGQRATAELLLDRGADIDWVGYDGLTPVEAAEREGAGEVVSWLRGRE